MVDLAKKQQQTQKTMTQMRPFWERDDRAKSCCPGDCSQCCTTSSQLRDDGKHKSFALFLSPLFKVGLIKATMDQIFSQI